MTYSPPVTALSGCPGAAAMQRTVVDFSTAIGPVTSGEAAVGALSYPSPGRI